FAIRSLGFGPNMLRHDQAEKIKRPTTLLNGESGVGTYEDANEEIKSLFGGEGVMDYPKPTSLIKYLVRAVTYWDQEGIVLDFFAGSCTTAQAVLDLNREDGGRRRFLMVQLPEPTGRKDFPTIAEAGKERIRRVIASMKNEAEGKLDLQERDTPEDLGFKVFKLAGPHIRPWAPEGSRDADRYATQLALFKDPLAPGWKPENVLWEVALREGYGLNTRFEKKILGGAAGSGNTVWEVSDPDSGQSFAVCLDDTIRADLSRCYDLSPDRLLVCRDAALDDTAAANLALQCRLKTSCARSASKGRPCWRCGLGEGGPHEPARVPHHLDDLRNLASRGRPGVHQEGETGSAAARPGTRGGGPRTHGRGRGSTDPRTARTR